jgi:DNA-binding SARP family transcriptional activator
MLNIQLMGQFCVQADGCAILLPSRPAQSLLARLALTPGVTHRREKLAGELWPEANETNARSNLRHALWRIRRALARNKSIRVPALLHADNIAVGLNLCAEISVDALEVMSLAQDPYASTNALIHAAGLYRGELLPGFYEDWIGIERIRLQTAFEMVMHRLLTRLCEEQRWREAVRWGTHWFAHGESSEAACRALMVAHHAQGNMDGVRAAYRLCAQHLGRELGMEPTHETRALFERLLHTVPVEGTLFVGVGRTFSPDKELHILTLMDEHHWQIHSLMHFDALPAPMW